MPPAQRHEPDTNGETPLNHRGVTCCTDHADRRDEASGYRPPNIPQRLNGRRATDRRKGSGDLPHNAASPKTRLPYHRTPNTRVILTASTRGSAAAGSVLGWSRMIPAGYALLSVAGWVWF